MRIRGGTRAAKQAAVTLTPRQQEVMRLLQRGLTNGQIAEQLGISLDGAKFHVAEIISKLGANSREEAVTVWASRRRPPWVLVGAPAIKWASGAAAASIIGVAVVWLAHGASGSSSHPSDCAKPTRPVPSIVDGTHSIVDWLPFVNFAGIQYLQAGTAGRIDTGRLGAPYAETTVQVPSLDPAPDAGRQDCASSFLPPGTVFYRIDGYDPHFRIATSDGTVYQAFAAFESRPAGDFLDLRGKVTSIQLSDQEGAPLALIKDLDSISRLVDQLQSSPFDPAVHGSGRFIGMTWYLSDETSLGSSLAIDMNIVAPGIIVPESFTQTILAAISQP
jgi:DNA-binding CsgD family transcriptional regulator